MLLLVLLDSLPPDMTSSPSLEVYCTYVSTDTIFWPLRATEWGGGAVSSQNVGTNGNACGLQKRPPYMYGVHWTSLLKQEVESNTLWGVFQGRRKPPTRPFVISNKLKWVYVLLIKGCICIYVCLLVCACVSKREEGPLTLCKKDSCGLQEGFWCCASSLMHFLSSRAATLGNYDDDYYEDQTYGLEGHANSKTRLNQRRRPAAS